MSGRRPPSKPEIPETPFRDTHAIPPTEGLAAGGRLSHRESDKWAKHPPILEDQEHHQQEAEKSLQYISSRDSERPRETKSQLGSRESNRTPEYPSRDSRGSSANSRCPFLPCPGCIEKCLDTQDEQQHYRPSWAYMAIVPFLLMTVMALSLAPLAGYQGGWAGFRMNNINSDIMVQLELAPWNHYINIGYNKFTNALRAYFSSHDWKINGVDTTLYAHLWDFLKYGNEAQLLGGYAAGWLLFSALTALVYLGFWAKCAVLLWRLSKGERRALQEPGKEGSPASLTQWTIRPLGAWLWPMAVVHMVVLVALLTAFLLVVQASNEYQCLHVAPGIDCTVQPGWALWCGYGASFAWLALAVIAIIEAAKQRPASLNHPNYAMPSLVQSRGTDASVSQC